MITPKYDDDLEYDEDDLLFQVKLLKNILEVKR